MFSESGFLDIDSIDPVCSSKLFLVTLTPLNKNRSLVLMFSLTDNVHGLNANLLNYSVEKVRYNEQVHQYPEPLRSIQIIVTKLSTIYYGYNTNAYTNYRHFNWQWALTKGPFEKSNNVNCNFYVIDWVKMYCKIWTVILILITEL